MGRFNRAGTGAGSLEVGASTSSIVVRAAALLVASIGLVAGAPALRAQVVINEVLADNSGVMPFDVGARSPDLIELYNTGDTLVSLGTANADTSYWLSDTPDFDPATAWRFPAGRANIEPGGSLLIFCDEDIIEALCELHAKFQIDSNGNEPITLWGPVQTDGGGESFRPIVDQVWLPPLRGDVSFGRYPDGAGPAPVEVGETFDHFVFNVVGTESPPTFQIGAGEEQVGGCETSPVQTTPCQNAGGIDRICRGAPNGPGVLAQGPRVERDSHSTNRPAADEPVSITLRVWDDEEPSPFVEGEESGSIVAVEVRYRVDGGDLQSVTAQYDEATGVLPDLGTFDPLDPQFEPLDRHTFWTATIPAQAAGAVVEFHYYVEDRHGLWSTRPRDLCDVTYPETEGPVCTDCPDGCDREYGGEGCVRDELDVTCDDEGSTPVVGQRYLACDGWYSYVSGFTPSRPELASLVINEVVPSQDGLLLDKTQMNDCTVRSSCAPTDSDCCPEELPECCNMREDFIELYNASDAVISLEGVGLTDAFFEPKKWTFPAGSKIGPGEYLIVWVDNDGSKCPQPTNPNPPCFWECPDPNNPALQEYHTNFNIDRDVDQIYLTDVAGGYGILHGVSWSENRKELPVQPNQAIALIPDGDPAGTFVVCPTVTVDAEAGTGAPNLGSCGAVTFRRGDADVDCGVALTDAIFLLNFLFLGSGDDPPCHDAADANDSGGLDLTDAVTILSYLFLGAIEPAPPGPMTPGVDPTEDTLPTCVYDAEGCP